MFVMQILAIPRLAVSPLPAHRWMLTSARGQEAHTAELFSTFFANDLSTSVHSQATQLAMRDPAAPS
jgi:hypothetical protein